MKTKHALPVTMMAVAMLATAAIAAHPEAPLALNSSGDFVILAKTGISTVPYSDITGDMGVSPILATAITGFSLIMDPSGEFSTSAQVTGNIYAPDYMNPTPAKMTLAITDMEDAYTEAAGRTLPDATELMAGDISGLTLTPGLYKWSTGVLINQDVWLDAGGDAGAVFIFQIAGDLTMAGSKKIILSGGAQAKNIFWQVGGGAGAVIKTYAHFEGIVLTAKAITLQTGASFNGKLLAQTRVNLDQNLIVDPVLILPPPGVTNVTLTVISEHGTGAPLEAGLPPAGKVYTNAYGTALINNISAQEMIGGTQYVNTGWSMIGNRPLAGSLNTLPMIHTNDAVLTWLWTTNYLLNAQVMPPGAGSVTGDTNGFYAAGSMVSILAGAAPGWAFAGWTGDVTSPTNSAAQTMTMDQARTVTALFVVTDPACGTPVTLGAFMELDLSARFTGANLTYAATSTRPGVMSASITGADMLRLEALTPDLTVISVTATDAILPPQLYTFPVAVVGHPLVLSRAFTPHEPWNPRFEQRFVVKNNTGNACPAIGLRLLFSNIKPGIIIENQTGLTPAPDGRPMIEWEVLLPNGAIEELSVIYVSTGAFRPDQYPPTVEVQYILPNTPPLPDPVGGVRITSIRILPDGRVVLEFASVAGRSYAIDYMNDYPTGIWRTVPLVLYAGGNRTQWIDYGPPSTLKASGVRVYRMREVSP